VLLVAGTPFLFAPGAGLTTACSTVEQMRLVNALCRFPEIADAQRRDAERTGRKRLATAADLN
jgi:hypothetical protein